mmetsp:Transcript_65927/g.153205  ORF Transcript_65927/g.153205 Transcript_65927/m.153205 type:complete len:323 (-) Transcript_65927:465-1433(-)
MSLATAIQGLDVLRFRAQDSVAHFPGVQGIGQAEAARRSVEAADLPQVLAALEELGLAQEAVPRDGRVHVVEEVYNVSVPLACKPESAINEEPAGLCFPPEGKRQPVLLVKAPHIWTFLVVHKCHSEGCALSNFCIFKRLTSKKEARVSARHQRRLVPAHFKHGALEGIADFSIANRHTDIRRAATTGLGEQARSVFRPPDLLNAQHCKPLIGRSVTPVANTLFHDALDDITRAFHEGAIARAVYFKQLHLQDRFRCHSMRAQCWRRPGKHITKDAHHGDDLPSFHLHERCLKCLCRHFSTASLPLPEAVLNVEALVDDGRV